MKLRRGLIKEPTGRLWGINWKLVGIYAINSLQSRAMFRNIKTAGLSLWKFCLFSTKKEYLEGGGGEDEC